MSIASMNLCMFNSMNNQLAIPVGYSARVENDPLF